MNETMTKIVAEIDSLEERLTQEIEKYEKEINTNLKNGRIKFEKEIIDKQKESMKNLFTYFKEIPFLHLITSPIIYAMIIPAFILDIVLFIYQHTIFRIYKFQRIKRSDYIVFDRQFLAYLNTIEKLNCIYCSYFNGLMAYALEIAARTELYFCPIKHSKKTAYKHSQYKRFLEYGESKTYQTKLKELRESLREEN